MEETAGGRDKRVVFFRARHCSDHKTRLWKFSVEGIDPPVHILSADHDQHASAMVVLGRFMYIMGGVYWDPQHGISETLNHVYRIDLHNLDQGWTRMPDMLRKRFNPEAVVVGEKIYVMGGMPVQDKRSTGHEWAEVYDPSSVNGWSFWPFVDNVDVENKGQPNRNLYEALDSEEDLSSSIGSNVIMKAYGESKILLVIGPWFSCLYDTISCCLTKTVSKIGTRLFKRGDSRYSILHGETCYYMDGGTGLLEGYKMDQRKWLLESRKPFSARIGHEIPFESKILFKAADNSCGASTSNGELELHVLWFNDIWDSQYKILHYRKIEYSEAMDYKAMNYYLHQKIKCTNTFLMPMDTLLGDGVVVW